SVATRCESHAKHQKPSFQRNPRDRISSASAAHRVSPRLEPTQYSTCAKFWSQLSLINRWPVSCSLQRAKLYSLADASPMLNTARPLGKYIQRRKSPTLQKHGYPLALIPKCRSHSSASRTIQIN